jgi:hypothetical protein
LVSLAQTKAQCVVDATFADDDALLSSLGIAARQYIEKLINRAIYDRTIQLNLDYFPYPNYSSTINPNDRHCFYGRYWHELAIRLPMPRAVSVQSITYVALDGTTQTLDPSLYRVDLNSEPARIVPAPGLYWPQGQTYLPGSVTITYTAGTYGDGVTVDTCPQTIKHAALMLVSYWYGNRDAAAMQPPKQVEFAVNALLAGEMFDTFGYGQ